MLEKQAYFVGSVGTEHEEINAAGQTQNRRVSFDRCIEVPSPSFFFFLKNIKNEEKKSFADWLIELANRGFGMSTDAFL